MSIFRGAVFIFFVAFTISAEAVPVSYTFSGSLTGDSLNVFSSVRLENIPFQVSIYGNSDNAEYLGKVAGAGSLYANTSTKAKWEVEGIGIASSSSAQIFTLPGVFRVGFSWDGIKYSLNSGQSSVKNFEFIAGEIGRNIDYGRLNNLVDSIPGNIITQLKNPPGTLPEYTTSIYFKEVGTSLTLKELTNITYSVSAIPVPTAIWMFGSGVFGVFMLGKRKAG